MADEEVSDTNSSSSSSNYSVAGLGILLILIAIGLVACYSRFNKKPVDTVLNAVTGEQQPIAIKETAMPEALMNTVSGSAQPADEPVVGALKDYDNSVLTISYPAEARVRQPSELKPHQTVRIDNLPVDQREKDIELNERDFYLDMRVSEGGDDCRTSTVDAQTATVNDITVYRGNAGPGSFKGYRSTMCFNREGSYYRFDVTEGSPRRFISKAIFDSLRIKK